MNKKIVLLVIVISIITMAFVGCTEQSYQEEASQTVLKIGAIPDQNAEKLNKRFDQLAEHISSETGLEVEYVPTVDYAALVTGFSRDEIHLGWFGGLTGVQARNTVEGSEAIAQRPRDEKFESVFIARKDLTIESIKDLKGHTFTFGSESSTSGHLMPRHFLIESNIIPENAFDGEVNYSGSHDKTWKLVEAGSFDAGALNKAVWESAVEDNKVDLEKVDVFYVTPTYYDYNWTIANVDESFGEGTKEKIQNALLSFGEKYPETMDLFADSKFIKTSNDNYKAIEDVAKSLGIIEEE